MNEQSPFKHIALSLSGGGTRAIGFHIGTLEMLDRHDLLPHVRMLSTVSGGSLVGGSYALALAERLSYQDLFYDFFEFLPGANIVESLANVLIRKNRPVPGGSRDLATGLAEIYHEEFFSRYFSDPYFGAINVGNPDDNVHFEDFSFNATDFRSGIAFRFQKSIAECKIGNFNSWLSEDVANEVRMADIVTASSCIPAMFEPLRLPIDFHWPADFSRGERKGTPLPSQKLHFREGLEPTDNLALMDGGVYDNQGLTTVLLAISRRLQQNDEESETLHPQGWAHWSRDMLERFSIVDLFIISDTPLQKAAFLQAFKAPTSKKGLSGWLRRRTLGDVNRFATTMSLVLLISSVWALLRIFDYGEFVHFKAVLAGGWFAWVHIILEVVSLLIPLALSALIGVSILWVRKRIHDGVENAGRSMPPLQRKPWYYLRRARLGGLMDMVKARQSSIMAMVSDIFSHRIRQLGYGLAYANAKVAPTLLANEIHALQNDQAGDLPKSCSALSTQARAIAIISAQMPTRSWFDRLTVESLVEDSQGILSNQQARSLVSRPNGDPRTDLDVLVASGQLTFCFNLIARLFNEFNGEAQSALLSSLIEDWNQLQDDPFSIIDERLGKGRSKRHQAQIDRNSGQSE